MIHVEELTPPPDPWEIAQRLSHLPHLLFLDSADRGTPSALNRYSFVTADPMRWLMHRTDEPGCPTFDTLQGLIDENRCDSIAGVPPFQGGLAGLFGYDLCHLTERLPRPKLDDFRVPDMAVGVYDWVISWDHQQNRSWLIERGRVPKHLRMAIAESAFGKSPSVRPPSPDLAGLRSGTSGLSRSLLPQVKSNFTRLEFESAVARIVEYIHAGDCFQVNLAQRLVAPACDPLPLYGRLRTLNEAPFSGYLDLGEFVIASASPERFLKVDPTGQVETRPIKGTRARHADREVDRQLIRELKNSPKDRAENVMIIDLLRNDLGKVCRFGSIRVNKVCELETYRTVHHLVSEVAGRLRPEKSAVDLFRGAFPGGSVTGAPKIRAMEIIAELEPTARGPYCGSLGYLGFDGSMDSNILIRTFTIGGGAVQFPVGAGIVADSDPAREYDETLAKAEGLLRALPS